MNLVDDDLNNPGLPPEQVVALTKAAVGIAAEFPHSILPRTQITTAETEISHLISEVYLVRLRNAADRGTLSNDAQLYLGAAIGLFAPALECLYKIIRAPASELTAIQTLSLMGFCVCAFMTFSLRRAKKSHETVDLICKEIESRNGTPVASKT